MYVSEEDTQKNLHKLPESSWNYKIEYECYVILPVGLSLKPIFYMHAKVLLFANHVALEVVAASFLSTT